MQDKLNQNISHIVLSYQIQIHRRGILYNIDTLSNRYAYTLWHHGMDSLSALQAFLRGTHRSTLGSLHKGPVMWSIAIFFIVSLHVRVFYGIYWRNSTTPMSTWFLTVAHFKINIIAISFTGQVFQKCYCVWRVPLRPVTQLRAELVEKTGARRARQIHKIVPVAFFMKIKITSCLNLPKTAKIWPCFHMGFFQQHAGSSPRKLCQI